jgi:hypothetical protein
VVRVPGIMAAALALLAGAARAAPADDAGTAPADHVPGLAQSLAVHAPPASDREPDGSRTAPSLEQLPLESRTDPLSYVGDHVPGALTVPGGISIHGAEARETALYVDGARASRLVLPLGMLERLEVLTAGYGASLADVTGGAILARSAREARTLALDVGQIHELGRHSDDITSIGVGTPLVGDRLFLRVAADLQLQRWDGAKDVEGILPDTADPTQRTLRGATKLIWLPRRDQRLELLAAGDFTRQDHIADISVLPDAQPRHEASGLALSALWQGRLTQRLTGRAQLFGERNLLREQPLECAGGAPCTDVPQYDHFPRLRLSGNWTRNNESIQRAMELVAAVEAPLPETSWLRSLARFSTRTRATDYRASVRYPGDRLVELNGTIPAYETVFFANDPRLGDPAFGPVHDDASGLRLMQTLEVPVTVASQLQLSPGLALVTARARTARGDRLQQSSFAPAISANWQAPSALPLWLRAGIARRVDADLDFLSNRSPPSVVARRCAWSPDTGAYDRECTFTGGRGRHTLGLPCSPLGLDESGRPCRVAAGPPHAWEATIGFGLAPWRALRADFDVVERRGDHWQAQETNRVWDTSGTRVIGYSNGRFELVTDLSRSPVGGRRHRSLHSTLTATPGPLAVTLAHVYSRNTEAGASAGNAIANPWGADSPQARWDDGGRQFLYGRAMADLGGYISVGALYRYAQGEVYGRLFRNDVTNSYENRRSVRGANPGSNLNDPSDDGSVRLPKTEQLSLQLRGRGRRLVGIDADVYLDMMRIVQSSPSNQVAVDGPSFIATSISDSWYRIGLEYRY